MKYFLSFLFLINLSISISAQEDLTRLLRFPDISKDKIAFVYAGDIWIVDANGGTARQLATGQAIVSTARITWIGGPVLRARMEGPFNVYEALSVGAQQLLGEVISCAATNSWHRCTRTRRASNRGRSLPGAASQCP